MNEAKGLKKVLTVLGAFAFMQVGSALGYGIKTADGFVLAPGMALGR